MPYHRSLGRARVAALALTAVLLSVVVAAPGVALPDDRDQPIHISADRAIRNEKKGITIYSGNVQMRQGSMELDADSLVVFQEGEDANKLVARGEPAAMRQQPEPDEGLVRAYGRVITYYRDKEQVNLLEDARIERDDGSLVTGDSIDYFITKQLVTAKSNTSETGNKVFVVIPPSLHQDEEGQVNESGEDGNTEPTASGEATPAVTGEAPHSSVSSPESDTSEAENGAAYSE